MSKQFLLSILLFAVAGSNANAQQGPGLLEKFQKDYRLQMRLSAVRGTAAKTTGTGSRLIHAYTGEGRTGGVIANLDSTSYTYSGSRGGDLDSWAVPSWINTPPCDTMIERDWVPATASYSVRHLSSNTYNGSNQLDSSTEYFSDQPGWIYRSCFGYNASGLVSNVVQLSKDLSAGTPWTPTARFVISYSGTGKIAGLDYDVWDQNTASWKPQQHNTIFYNHSDQPRLEVIEQYTGAVKNVTDSSIYSYDAFGSLISLLERDYDFPSATFYDLARYRYYYNGSQELIAETFEREHIHVLQREDSTTYRSSTIPPGSDTTIHYTWNASSSAWVLDNRSISTAGASGKTETKLVEYANLGPFHYNDQRTFYFYNGFGQETREYSQSLVNGNWVIYPNNDHDKRYYYELFNTGINSLTSAPGIGIVLLPVPAGNNLTAVLNFDNRQHFTAFVTDATGRKMYSWSDVAAGVYTRELDTRNLPSGTYYLSVRSAAGAAGAAFTVRH